MSATDIVVQATVGEIARRVGAELHQVEYLIRTRRIQPVSRAGATRVFSESDVAFIAAELKRIAREKSDKEGRQ